MRVRAAKSPVCNIANGVDAEVECSRLGEGAFRMIAGTFGVMVMQGGAGSAVWA